MPDFLELSREDQREALLVAAARSGRPLHLLEKDVWVMWALNHLFAGPHAKHLVFKGGTSLSKAYGVIRRFSEDVDLTYDIRAIAPDLVGKSESPWPTTRSQEKKWSKAIRQRLAELVAGELLPEITKALQAQGLPASARAEREQIFIDYDALGQGTGYVRPSVLLEFGARSTGEPNEPKPIVCDAAAHLQDLSFPKATPQVMRAERTFWEKATAIHVFCAQGSFRGGARFARHWHDVTRLDAAGFADSAAADRELAQAVAVHKSVFFAESAPDGTTIDYGAAVKGALVLVPKGDARTALADDYQRMVEDGLLMDDAEPFDSLLDRSQEIEIKVNSTVRVLALLAGFTERPEVAAVVLDEALRLFTDDDPASARPWDAYQDLVPGALRSFPVGFELSAGRLYVSARRALERMSPEHAVSLAGAWVEWLERQLANNQLPDDYALGLWDGVVRATNFPPLARLALLERLLAFTSTGCAIVFVADMVDEWDVLTTEERDRVLAILRSDRPDAVWLQAAALARKHAPPEIQHAVLGADDALSWTPDRLIKHIADHLLQACVRIHCGSPQPLWYLGKHHGSDSWKAIVAHIGRQPDHPLFEVCFAELIRQLDDDELNAAAADLAAAGAWQAFDILIDRKIGVTGEWHRDAVDTFLQAADPQTLAKMQAQMIDRAPAVLDELAEVAEWTTHKATQRALLDSLSSDELPLKTLWILRQASESSPSHGEAKVLLELMRQSPPRLHGTYRAVQDVLEASGGGAALIQEVDAQRQAAVEAKYSAINAMRVVDKSVLSHWTGPA